MAEEWNLTKHPYQINVVNNYRQAFKAKFGRDCKLSDKDIWEIQASTLGSTSEEKDDWVLDALAEESPE